MTPIFLNILTSWVKIRLHNENQRPSLSESALTVKVGGVAQDMW
jgi:hypothetical protein